MNIPALDTINKAIDDATLKLGYARTPLEIEAIKYEIILLKLAQLRIEMAFYCQALETSIMNATSTPSIH